MCVCMCRWWVISWYNPQFLASNWWYLHICSSIMPEMCLRLTDSEHKKKKIWASTPKINQVEEKRRYCLWGRENKATTLLSCLLMQLNAATLTGFCSKYKWRKAATSTMTDTLDMLDLPTGGLSSSHCDTSLRKIGFKYSSGLIWSTTTKKKKFILQS